MKKYIEADLLKQKVESLWYGENTCDEFYNSGYDDAVNDVIDIMDNMPAADVQEVIRCKDCKHLCKDLSGRDVHLCMRCRLPREVTLDSYCSCGAIMDGKDGGENAIHSTR